MQLKTLMNETSLRLKWSVKGLVLDRKEGWNLSGNQPHSRPREREKTAGEKLGEKSKGVLEKAR